MEILANSQMSRPRSPCSVGGAVAALRSPRALEDDLQGARQGPLNGNSLGASWDFMGFSGVYQGLMVISWSFNGDSLVIVLNGLSWWLMEFDNDSLVI